MWKRWRLCSAPDGQKSYTTRWWMKSQKRRWNSSAMKTVWIVLHDICDLRCVENADNVNICNFSIKRYVSRVIYFPSPEIITLLLNPPAHTHTLVIEISGGAITWQSVCSKDTHSKQSWHTHQMLWSTHRCFCRKTSPGQLSLKGNYTWKALVCT